MGLAHYNAKSVACALGECESRHGAPAVPISTVYVLFIITESVIVHASTFVYDEKILYVYVRNRDSKS